MSVLEGPSRYAIYTEVKLVRFEVIQVLWNVTLTILFTDMTITLYTRPNRLYIYLRFHILKGSLGPKQPMYNYWGLLGPGGVLTLDNGVWASN